MIILAYLPHCTFHPSLTKNTVVANTEVPLFHGKAMFEARNLEPNLGSVTDILHSETVLCS